MFYNIETKTKTDLRFFYNIDTYSETDQLTNGPQLTIWLIGLNF